MSACSPPPPADAGAPIERLYLSTPSDLNRLNEVLAWADRWEAQLSEAILGECKLVLAEGFTNAVQHAHRGLSADTPVELELTLFCDRVEIAIWDRGQPFDLQRELDRLRADPRPPLEKESGRGLLFMDCLTDSLTYSRLPDSRNCLRACKHLQDCPTGDRACSCQP